jgi:LacI family transcriptional regulator
MAAKIDDVAKKARVSISTVSRVLNGHRVVKAETRERVERAIKQLAYRPSVYAQGLARGTSDIANLDTDR